MQSRPSQQQIENHNHNINNKCQLRAHKQQQQQQQVEPAACEQASRVLGISKSNRKMSTPIKRQHGGLTRLTVAASEWTLPGVCLTALVSCALVLALAAHESSHLAGAGEIRHHGHRRVKRALYDLPDGSEQLLSASLRTTFTCDGLGYGYYADQDNDCKIFHICQSFKMSDGSIYNNHWSFICPNQTVFNQVSLACSHPEDAVPCESAKEFYHVNDYFGDTRAPSVKDSDLSLASDMISRSYGSRLSSPGN